MLKRPSSHHFFQCVCFGCRSCASTDRKVPPPPSDDFDTSPSDAFSFNETTYVYHELSTFHILFIINPTFTASILSSWCNFAFVSNFCKSCQDGSNSFYNVIMLLKSTSLAFWKANCACEPIPILMTHECRYTGVQTGSHTSMALKCQASGITPALPKLYLPYFCGRRDDT